MDGWIDTQVDRYIDNQIDRQIEAREIKQKGFSKVLFSCMAIWSIIVELVGWTVSHNLLKGQRSYASNGAIGVLAIYSVRRVTPKGLSRWKKLTAASKHPTAGIKRIYQA